MEDYINVISVFNKLLSSVQRCRLEIFKFKGTISFALEGGRLNKNLVRLHPSTIWIYSMLKDEKGQKGLVIDIR